MLGSVILAKGCKSNKIKFVEELIDSNKDYNTNNDKLPIVYLECGCTKEKSIHNIINNDKRAWLCSNHKPKIKQKPSQYETITKIRLENDYNGVLEQINTYKYASNFIIENVRIKDSYVICKRICKICNTYVDNYQVNNLKSNECNCCKNGYWCAHRINNLLKEKDLNYILLDDINIVTHTDNLNWYCNDHDETFISTCKNMFTKKSRTCTKCQINSYGELLTNHYLSINGLQYVYAATKSYKSLYNNNILPLEIQEKIGVLPNNLQNLKPDFIIFDDRYKLYINLEIDGCFHTEDKFGRLIQQQKNDLIKDDFLIIIMFFLLNELFIIIKII